MRVKAFRSLFAVILSCVIAWNGFASPAFAATNDSVDSSINGFASFPAFTTSDSVDSLINGVASPDFAASDSVGSFINGFWYAVGGAVGGATGIVVTCYTVDVLIASVAPPVAVYLAPMCGATGAVGGLGGGLAGVKAIAGAH